MMPTGDSLDRAISRVVDGTRPQAESLTQLLNELIKSLRSTRGDSAPAQSCAEAAAKIADALSDFGYRITAHLSSFNIVTFGRTGIGKSTIVSALGHGDGSEISKSKINHTVKTYSADWKSCSVWDVPGIDGEDGKADIEQLEKLAREKAAIADIVLLCFDTTSTEYSIFKKIAGWVIDFGKPTIALLNVRNPYWRFEADNSYPKHHLSSCRTVTDHVGHIRENLGAVGLPGVPLVAVNSLDAAYARAVGTDNAAWQGPALTAMTARAADAGDTAHLLAWSNLPALEELLTEAISSDAATLRLGSLVKEIDGALQVGAELLDELVVDRFRRQADVIERGIAQLLSILGAPEAVLGSDSADQELLGNLAKVERYRGGGFDAPRLGRAALHAQLLIGTKFGALRHQAHRHADAVIDKAMRDRKEVEPDSFARQVFDEEKIRSASKSVHDGVDAYVNEHVIRTLQDVAEDLRVVRLEQATIDGKAGRVLRWLSLGSKLVGSVTSAAAGVFALGWWNPLGWAAGTVALVGAFVSSAIGVIGWLTGRSSTRRRETAMAHARADAYQAVDRTFDHVQELADADTARALAQAIRQAVGPTVKDALDLHEAIAAAIGFRQTIADTRGRLPHLSADPVGLIRNAVGRCEARIVAETELSRSDVGPYLWLGESQRANPAAARDPGGTSSGHRGRWAAQRVRDAAWLRDWLRATVSGPWAIPKSGSGKAWLSGARRRLDGDTNAAKALRELAEIADGRPRVALGGSYNAGKSSMIRRLLIDDKQKGPDTLQTGDKVTTREVQPYEWRGLDLVDVPGLGGDGPEQDELSREQVPDAAAVIFVTGQGLQGLRDLVQVLAGDPTQGLLGKQDRTIIVLNRRDEIGASPLYDPDEHEAACQSKRLEVAMAINALAGGALAVVPERIFCTASAPFGMQGDTPADYDGFRGWDGIKELEEAIEALRPSLLANGRDVSILHGGIARLLSLRARRIEQLRTTRERQAQLTQLSRLASEQLADGCALIDAQVARLAARIGDHLEADLGRGLLSQDAVLRKQILNRLSSWTTADETQQIVGHWLEQSDREAGEWATMAGQDLRRRADSAAFRRAFGGDAAPVGLDFLRRGTRTGTQLLTEAGSSLGGALRAVDSETVDDVNEILNRFGLTLSPDLRNRLAEWAPRAGGGLLVIAGLVGAGLTIEDFLKGNRSDEQLRAAGPLLREQATKWARNVALGPDGAPGGLLDFLSGQCQELRNTIARLDNQVAELAAGASAMQQQIDIYADLVVDARDRLGVPREEQ
jgi:predicted GTPase